MNFNQIWTEEQTGSNWSIWMHILEVELKMYITAV